MTAIHTAAAVLTLFAPGSSTLPEPTSITLHDMREEPDEHGWAGYYQLTMIMADRDAVVAWADRFDLEVNHEPLGEREHAGVDGVVHDVRVNIFWLADEPADDTMPCGCAEGMHYCASGDEGVPA